MAGMVGMARMGDTAGDMARMPGTAVARTDDMVDDTAAVGDTADDTVECMPVGDTPADGTAAAGGTPADDMPVDGMRVDGMAAVAGRPVDGTPVDDTEHMELP
jgi:hypothetical protein